VNANNNAFPMERLGPNDTEQHGLTKRELFAMAAMQGLLPFLTHDEVQAMAEGTKGGRTLAKAAVVQADALLAVLEVPSGERSHE
jgi:hypothetical protein